jgi:hypothetical protein
MAAGHTFNVVIISPGHGVRPDATAAPDKTLRYCGANTEEKS